MQTELKICQKQTMSHRMIQSINILQMSSLDLEDYMKGALLENPIVDIETLFKETKQSNEGKENEKQIQSVENLNEEIRNYSYYTNDLKDNYLENIGGTVRETLADTLNLQLLNGSYTKKEFEIFNYIAQCLDSRGYFVMPICDMAEYFDISEEKAYCYLEIMKNLEPIGICAQSLQECLLKQLEVKGKKKSVEECIIKNYMEQLGKNQLEVIAKNLKVTVGRVREAQKVIQSLNPKPAQGFDNGELYHYIIPDITIVKKQDQLEILLNQRSCPSIKVNKEYLHIMLSLIHI